MLSKRAAFIDLRLEAGCAKTWTPSHVLQHCSIDLSASVAYQKGAPSICSTQKGVRTIFDTPKMCSTNIKHTIKVLCPSLHSWTTPNKCPSIPNEDTKTWSFIDHTGSVANQISAPFCSTQKLCSIVQSLFQNTKPESALSIVPFCSTQIDCFVYWSTHVALIENGASITPSQQNDLDVPNCTIYVRGLFQTRKR